MSDNARRKNDPRRSRNRKVDYQDGRQPTQRPQPQQPSTDSSNTEYSFDQSNPQPDLSVYPDMDEDAFMQEYFPNGGYGFGIGFEGLRKETSATTTTGSLLSIGSPSVVTENGTGSHVLVHHKRTYSEASKGTSGGSSDGRHFSVQDDAEWKQTAEPASSVEALEEDVVPGPHDQKYILSNMYSSEPRTFPNPYQTYMASSDIEPSYHESSNYVMQSGTQPPLTRAQAQNAQSGPWNQMYHQVSQYSTGFVAFAPSPGPAARHESDEVTSASPSASSPSGSAHSGKSRGASSCPKKSPTKGQGKSTDLGWEHITVSNGGLERIIENEEAACHRSGIRKGKLGPEAAAKARRIRRLKACWNCWIQKIPCSEGETCNRCMKQFSQFSPSADQLCSRAGFKDYVEIFFPDFLHAHLRKRKIEDLISEHTARFTNTFLDVEVSVGEVFVPMVLRVNMFQPKTQELIRHARLARDDHYNLQLFDAYSAPYGILGLEPQEMKNLCNAHIESMINNPQYPAQATAGDTSQVPYALLEIVVRFCACKDILLLRNTLKLHAIHYFMKSLVTFSDDSARHICASLPYPITHQPNLSSRLLNRQIKHVMHLLHRETTSAVLKDLEKSLRSRTKDYWAPSFCAIIVLCLCIEKLQTAADTMVVCDMQKLGHEAQWTRDMSYDACEKLDEYPFGMCKRLFHEIYRSHKEGNGGMRDGGFNPLRATTGNEGTGLDRETDEMVRGVWELICNSSAEIMDLAERQPLVGFGETVGPQAIKDNSNGRLAAKFLKSFFSEE